MKTKTLLPIALAISLASFAPLATIAKENTLKANVPEQQFSPLSLSERESLLYMFEEEKLARDVYQSLNSLWTSLIFTNIGQAEQRHMTQVKTLLSTYALIAPVGSEQLGSFYNAQLAGLYTQLLERGRLSLVEALQTGALIEETDIADLQKASVEAQHADIIQVYAHLLQGSRNHLRAFVSQLQTQGIMYQAQHLSQAEVDAIVQSPFECGNGHGQGQRGMR